MDDYLFPLYLFGSLLLTLFAITLTIFLIIQRQRQTRNKLEKQRLEFHFQTELLNTRLEVQEQSMSLLSEEIHDNIGQMLSLTKMYMASIKKKVQDDQGVQLVARTEGLISKIINDLRHISHSLNSNLIQQIGLIQLLERDLEHIRDSSGLDCSLKVNGTPYLFTAEKNLLIYRIIQEAVQNVLKHANASVLTIFVEYTGEALKIMIKDNGKGFDTAEAEKSQSLGLRNINSRSDLLKATLEISSKNGEGTTLHITIPVNATNGR